MVTDTPPASPNVTLTYPIGSLRRLRVIASPQEPTPPRPSSRPSTSRPSGKPVSVQPTLVSFDGLECVASGRFWSSLFHRYGLVGNVFRYFAHDEVFARVLDRNPDDVLRFCVEHHGDVDGQVRGKRPRLLAVSHPSRGLLDYGTTRDLIARHRGTDVAYGDGMVTARHTPLSGESAIQIGPDAFHHRFDIEVPVDGFGGPRFFLSLLREVCSNGAVGYARAFRSDVRCGTDAAHTLGRALDGFDSDEGFAALRQRFASSQTSWASVREVMALRKVLTRTRLRDESSFDALSRLNHVAGDLHAIYGLANLDTLSTKRQRVLPARCRVYDLINYASELATHHVTPSRPTPAPAAGLQQATPDRESAAVAAMPAGMHAKRALQAYLGTLLSEEYDLEGTAGKVPEFADLFAHPN